jgi:hypothetical protein
MRADIRATRARVYEVAAALAESRAEIAATRTALAELEERTAASRAETAATRTALAELGERTAADHRRTMEALKIVRDNDAAAWQALWRLRDSTEYALAFDEDEPLVTVIMPTYNNWKLMRERALPAVLSQTYERFECIVVGDAAPPEAAQVVSSFGDDRLRFVNLPYRGPYPDDPHEAWLVSGTTTSNTGLALARGRWILYSGDDDAVRPNCIESLLAVARAERAEVPYGRLHMCDPKGDGWVLGVFPPELGQWGAQCSLLHAGLRFLPSEPSDWLFGVPNDWSLADRMLRIGVRFAMLDETVADYYPSRLWTEEPW